jgi:hypothetical protein
MDDLTRRRMLRSLGLATLGAAAVPASSAASAPTADLK